MKVPDSIYGLFIILTFPVLTFAQQMQQQEILSDATLENCIQYAFKHQPVIQQSKLDEQIGETVIKSKIADWYPQVAANYSLQRYFDLPEGYSEGSFLTSGTFNTSSLGLSLNQNIFNNDIWLAKKSAEDVRRGYKQNTQQNKIDLAADVSKSFYDVLLTQKQVQVLDATIIRLERSRKDAFNQYNAGLVDKTDYKRATIELNNAQSQRKQTILSIQAKLVYLKGLIGYPDKEELRLQYDTMQLEKDADFDTLQTVNYSNRIEYQILQTQKRLQTADIKYRQYSFYPNVSAFGAYNLSYLNNSFSQLYGTSFPNSFIGLQINYPLFQGGKRVQQYQEAKYEMKRLDWDVIALQNRINTEYAQAISDYKSSLVNFLAVKDNYQLADDVYKTITMQYRTGVKTYLEVLTAETDLRTTQINYYNALLQLLVSKVDVEKALGILKTN